MRNSLLRKPRLLIQRRGRRTAAFGILDADDEAALILDAEICLDFAEGGGDGGGVDEVRGAVFGAGEGVDAFGDGGDGVDVAGALGFGFVGAAADCDWLVCVMEDVVG